jgi:hypothetical protein
MRVLSEYGIGIGATIQLLTSASPDTELEGTLAKLKGKSYTSTGEPLEASKALQLFNTLLDESQESERPQNVKLSLRFDDDGSTSCQEQSPTSASSRIVH